MFTDLMELAIDLLEFIVNRGWIMNFIDTSSDAINVAITFLPRIGLVLGYVSYFVDWTLVLPLLILGTASILIRVALAILSLIHTVLDSIPIIG